jgi:flagellar biosynthesis protein
MKDERKTAVALGYDPQRDGAPRVLASGRGWIAEQIIQIAREHLIPIREDRIAVELLSQVELGAEIPPELYQIVAEIYAFIYSLDRNYKQG